MDHLLHNSQHSKVEEQTYKALKVKFLLKTKQNKTFQTITPQSTSEVRLQCLYSYLYKAGFPHTSAEATQVPGRQDKC